MVNFLTFPHTLVYMEALLGLLYDHKWPLTFNFFVHICACFCNGKILNISHFICAHRNPAMHLEQMNTPSHRRKFLKRFSFCDVKFPNIKCAFSHIFVHTETQAGLLYANQPPLKGASQSCVRWERKYLHLNINTFREGCTKKEMYHVWSFTLCKLHFSDSKNAFIRSCQTYLLILPYVFDRCTLGN